MKIILKEGNDILNISAIHILGVVYEEGAYPYIKAQIKLKGPAVWMDAKIPLDCLIQEEI